MSFPLATTLRPALLPLLRAAPSLVYVDCGARAESENPLVEIFPEGRYIGFEPDEEECRRLNAAARPNYRFHPVALAGEAGEWPFHVTANPACSSLYAPDSPVPGRLRGVDGFLTPERVVRLRTRDTWTPFWPPSARTRSIVWSWIPRDRSWTSCAARPWPWTGRSWPSRPSVSSCRST
jgi:hypothetical protein